VEYKPTRINVARIYAKRAIRWRRNSWPYLSGDGFADISDCVLNPPKLRGTIPTLKQIRNAKVIFVRSLELQNFFDDYGSSLSAQVIISGNSDQEFHEKLNLPPSVKLLLLQNSFVSDEPRIQTLPIGIENLRWGVNGNPKFLNLNEYNLANNEILFGPFGLTHEARTHVMGEISRNQGPWNLLQGYIQPNEFDNLTSKYRYVAAVRGNGVDTHRLWEALYRGRYPIIQTDSWSRSLHTLGLPIIEVSEWNKTELSNIVSEPRAQFIPKKLPSLWMNYWIDKIRNVVG
jgi:hypothetical protein